MLTSLLLVTSAGVTFESRAERIPVLLDRLGPVIGKKLECDGVFANEVMVLAVSDVDASELLARIARASTGVWEKRGDEFVLRPDTNRRGEQEKTRVENRVKYVQTILDRCAKELATPYLGETPPEYRRELGQTAEHMAGQRRTPISRLAMRLMLAIGAKELASIEKGARRVYAVNPNTLQQPWPKGGDAAISEFRKEWEIREKVPHKRSVTIETGADLGGGWRLPTEGWSPTPDIKFARMWVSISDVLGREIGRRPVSLSLLDSRGFGVSGSLDLYTPPAPFRPAPTEEDPRELAYDPATVEFAKVYTSAYNVGHAVITRDSEVGKRILAPGFEPLSLGSELYLAYAKAKKLDLVSLVNDNSMPQVIGLARPKASDIEEVLRRITSYELEGGWLVTAPNQPAEARRSREDRKMMGRVLQDAADGRLSLDGECEYVASKPYGFTTNLALRLAAMFDTNQTGYSGVSNETAKRIYGLTPRAARRGGQVTYGQASKELKAALWHAVYDQGMIVEDRMPWEMLEGRTYTTSEEVTYLFPDGIAGDRVFDVEVKGNLEVRQSHSKENVSYGGDDPRQIARMLFFKDNPELVTGSRLVPAPDLFQPLRSESIFMRLRLPGYFTTAWLKDQAVLGPAGALDKLPAEHLKAIQDEIAIMNEQKAKGNPPRQVYGNGPTRGTPPPL